MSNLKKIIGKEKYQAIQSAQKMQDYLELYEELINMQAEFFAKSLESTNKPAKKGYRKLADETSLALKKVIEEALNDKQVWS